MRTETTPKRTFKDYLIPYYSCSYTSEQTKEEILSKIKSVTEPEKFFRFGGVFSNNNAKKYEGTLGISNFKISKIQTQRRTSKPVILGNIEGSNQNTVVNIKIRLTFFQMLFVPLWFLFVFGTAFKNESLNLFTTGEFSFNQVFPLLVLVVIYVVITGSFHYSVTKNLRFLEKIILPIEDASFSSGSNSDWIIRN